MSRTDLTFDSFSLNIVADSQVYAATVADGQQEAAGVRFPARDKAMLKSEHYWIFQVTVIKYVFHQPKIRKERQKGLQVSVLSHDQFHNVKGIFINSNRTVVRIV